MGKGVGKIGRYDCYDPGHCNGTGQANPNLRPTHNQRGKRQTDYNPRDMAEILRLEETLVEEHDAIKDLPAIVDLPRLYTNGNRINKTQLTAFDTFITNLQASKSAHDVKLRNKLRGINLKKTHE